MSWSASQYGRFEDERTRPVRDLVAATPLAAPRVAVDLGCGPGNSTEALIARFPDAQVSGIDSSPDMIAAARRRLPDVAFEVAEVEAWDPPAPVDLILANAVLQWIPGHEALFPRLVRALAPGGALAVQMPDNLDEPAHTAMRQTAAEPPWRDLLAKAAEAREARRGPEWYFGLLAPLCARVQVWRTTYHHPLAGLQAVEDWFKGSGLRPFLAPLDADQATAFLASWRAKIARAYPALPGGGILLPFPRLFIVAVR